METIIKLSLVIILALAGLSYWYIPKSKWRLKFQMTDRIYILTQFIGLLCGIGGLIATFVFPHSIIELHLWELILIPYVLIQTYWLIVMKIRKTTELLDEKQEMDMGKAGGLTFVISIVTMTFVFHLYYTEMLSGIIWFPLYLFISIFLFSGITLYYFKKLA